MNPKNPQAASEGFVRIRESVVRHWVRELNTARNCDSPAGDICERLHSSILAALSVLAAAPVIAPAAQQEGAPPVFFVKQDGTHGEYPPADQPAADAGDWLRLTMRSGVHSMNDNVIGDFRDAQTAYLVGDLLLAIDKNNHPEYTHFTTDPEASRGA